MYNGTDGKGHCYTAYCDLSCGTEIRPQPCNFTPPPTPGCLFLNPPRKVFELKFVVLPESLQQNNFLNSLCNICGHTDKC